MRTLWNVMLDIIDSYRTEIKTIDLNNMTMERLVHESGLCNMGTFDYAVPQAWRDDNPDVKAVWFYAPGSLSGRAVTAAEMMWMILTEKNRNVPVVVWNSRHADEKVPDVS